MSAPQASATTASTATEEDYFRSYNSGWRATAYGRETHYRTCTATDHSNCAGAR